MDLNITHLFALLIGVAGGAVGMFFFAQKNPKWVQEIYEKQKNATRPVLSPVEQKLAEAEKKLADLELDKKIEEKINQLKGK